MSEETLKIGKKKVGRPRKVKEVPETWAYSNCPEDIVKIPEPEFLNLNVPGIEGIMSQNIEVLKNQKAIVRNQIILGCTVFLNALSVLLLAYLEKHS